MTDATRPRDLPHLSDAARGLCGVLFSDGTRSEVQLRHVPVAAAAAADELLRLGIVDASTDHRGAATLRGTDVAAAVGWHVMTLAASPACPGCRVA